MRESKAGGWAKLEEFCVLETRAECKEDARKEYMDATSCNFLND